MDDLNQQIQAFLEKRDAERVSARLSIKFHAIERKEADRILSTGDFADAFAAELGPEGDAVADAFTENISVSGIKFSGDMRLIGGKLIPEGSHLLVEVSIPDAPIPVRALATVVWSEADENNPQSFHAGLLFMGINKQDIMKVARFLVLQRRAQH
jgi:hypothetical protein